MSEGGITRILRLYLKALCELAAEGDRVRFVSLNDRIVGSSELQRYSGERLVEWRACGGSRIVFSGGALRLGLRSDRIVCGHIGQLPLAWAAALLRPRLSYYLVAHGIEVWRPFYVPGEARTPGSTVRLVRERLHAAPAAEQHPTSRGTNGGPAQCARPLS